MRLWVEFNPAGIVTVIWVSSLVPCGQNTCDAANALLPESTRLTAKSKLRNILISKSSSGDTPRNNHPGFFERRNYWIQSTSSRPSMVVFGPDVHKRLHRRLNCMTGVTWRLARFERVLFTPRQVHGEQVTP
jgi:hypothetical protein